MGRYSNPELRREIARLHQLVTLGRSIREAGGLTDVVLSPAGLRPQEQRPKTLLVRGIELLLVVGPEPDLGKCALVGPKQR